MTNAAPVGAPPGTLTIVALGASAGGLDALQGFFAAMPADPRLAFVVITHLPPLHASRMAEILGRVSAMPVREARDGEHVEPAHVYVIPPNCLMGITKGALRLEDAAPRPAVPHPIDFFMSALADDCQERSVGIVLSGADHDGTAGLKEIKAAGGLVLVQDPASAQFPGMPASAIATGVPDSVLTVDKMGSALVDYVEHGLDYAEAPPAMPDADAAVETTLPARLAEILRLVRERSGQDFRWYRPAMLLRRLRRRMGLRSIGTASAYLDFLKESDQEVEALVKDFRISVTEFFRQPAAWHVLETEVLPQLVEERIGAQASVRVWTPGCATGEESYSIAMLLLEQIGTRHSEAPVSVFGSDVDAAALTVARAGSYPESITDFVSPPRLARFFEKRGDRYVVRKPLREAVIFAPQDLVRDPPFSKLDLIVCRNVLIYFEPAQQSRLIEMFHFALNPNGILFLGKSENLGAQSVLFEPVSAASRIFRRVGSTTRLPRHFEGQWSGPSGYLTPSARPAHGRGSDPAERVRSHLGHRAVSAAVLVNRDYRALYFYGETGRYLQPAGEPASDLLSLLREGLRGRVRASLQRAINGEAPVEARAQVRRDGQFLTVRVLIERLADYERSGLLLVSFDDLDVAPSGRPADEPAEASAMQEELRHARAELAAAEQEAENTAAELRVANEEAMSLNEELQSSNEELQTSKEELQSMNEELASVNGELEDKVGELQRTLGDLRNLMDNTRVAMLFLDRELRIRRFTSEATRLFRLIESDEGRPLQDLAFNVTDPDLLTDAAGVLQDLAPREAEVQTTGQDWLLRRILPYRAVDGRIEGVVVAYTDISAVRRAAQDARRLATVLRDSNDAVIVHDFSGRILSWNHGAERTYGYTQQAALELDVRALEPSGRAGTALDLASRVREATSAGPVVAQRITQDGRLLDVSVTVSALRDEGGKAYAVVSTEHDVTESLRQESELRFRAMADDIPTLLRIEDRDGRAQYLNRAWLAFTGETAADALLVTGWFRYVHPDDLAGYQREMKAARDNGRRFEQDLRLRRADGRYRWFRATAVPRNDQPGYVCVSVDIEERKRAERAVAEEAEHKDEFLAMLAHELRNPLAPIANAASVIERRAAGDAKVGWAAGVIGRQVEQLSRLVDDLMDAARIASGKVALGRELIDLPALVERARDLTEPMIESHGQHLEIVLPPETLYVEGDMVRLTQVLGNLLANASKYSGRGDKIRLAVSSAGDDVVIEVTDQGLGISAEMLPRVFDLFAQDDKTLDRARGGLGIGLSLVDRLVRAHGGSVEARSEGRGCGSQFVVRLPAIHPPRAQPREEAAVAVPPQGGARRILVVDDNVDNLKTTAILLEATGHDVRTAKDGPEALTTARQFRPQVVICDIGLPGMSGYDVARALRGSGETAHAVMVAATGYGRPEDAERAKAAGFDHLLVKPMPFPRLLDIVQAAAVK